MKRLCCLVLVALACGCSSKATPPEVCQDVCQKLASCDTDPGGYQGCVTGFQCASWTDQKVADCEQACLSQPSCSDAYVTCRDQCIGTETSCNASCGSCASDEVCFGGLLPNTSTVEFSATCRKKCASDDDCPTNEKCVDDPTLSGRFGPVCLPAGLTRCDQLNFGGCKTPSTCRDADTLAQVYFDNNSICGAELIRCPNGCEGPTTDGGVPDGGMEAHCR